MENSKKNLIHKIINTGIDNLSKTRDDHSDMIKDYMKNGFGDMHPNNIESYKTGLHYTHGYTIGHIELLKKINNLLEMSEVELIDLIKENGAINKENEKRMNELLNNIKNKVNGNE